MRRSISASPPARASRGAAALAALLLLVAAAAAQPAAAILVVDIERAVRESAVASGLREIELRERRALQSRFDALKLDLEAQEAALTRERDSLDKKVFDQRVRDFDRQVRQVRRQAQEQAAALQARFAAAQRALAEQARPLAEALMRDRGAVIVLDRKAVLAADGPQDVTEALTAEIDRRIGAPERLLPDEAPARTP